MKPLLSIIIPSYNTSAFISQCIRSISEQSEKDYEVWIIDGLSTDDTIGIVEEFSAKNSFIHFVSEKDEGIYDAMNKGIGLATGEWLLFLGSDDQLYDSHVLKNISAVLENSVAGLVYGNVMVVGDAVWAHDGDIYDGPFTVEKLFIKNICHQSIFYRRIFFNKLGNFNTRYKIAADWDLNHRFFAQGDIQFTDQIISKFFAGGESSQMNRNDLFTSEDLVLNLKRYHHISYYNKLYHPYAWVFYNLSVKYLMEKNVLKSLRFLNLSIFHSNRKWTNFKSWLANALGRNKTSAV